MKLLFVVNPVSGVKKKESFMEEAVKMCSKHDIQHEIFDTTGEEDIKRLSLKISSFSPDRIASVGGDGTNLLVASVLKDKSIPMGIVPMGSANGLAEELEIDPEPIDALMDIIDSDRVAGLDMIEVNEKHYSIHIGDVGSNASIVENFEKDPNRGILTYAKYFLKEVEEASPFKVKIKTDKEEVEESALMVAICNSRKFGTGIPLTMDGDPMDGKFEIVILEEINIASLLKIGLSKFNERFFDNQLSKIISAKKAVISFDKPRLLQLDGEIIGEFKNLKVEIRPGAVNLILKEKKN